LVTSASKGRLSLFASSSTVINQIPWQMQWKGQESCLVPMGQPLCGG